MAHRDIVVIGASAGGIPALTTLVAGLPADLAAALFVVVHVPNTGTSRLPEVLSHAGPLPAHHAEAGEPIEHGQITVAPPDYHLLLRRGRVELDHGPRENHARPAIDPLFRTAARAYGPRGIGIVLSGALYDGSLGLMSVKTRGGIAIVQDPAEAVVDSMPRNALKLVAADYILPAGEIAPVVTALTQEDVRDGGSSMIDDEERLELVVAEDFAEQADGDRADETTVYTCPECGGVLWQGGAGPALWFRCHVGHVYASEILLGQKAEQLEAALWSSLRLLKEKATLSRQLANRSRESGLIGAAERVEERALLDEQHARAIQDLLKAMPGPGQELMEPAG
ncbi:MAG: chemotaxis protein CheB [Thermomicrobiales bacterium]|nr:chemotaxis protein CheB [Thermomicrobiales bacterium]